MNLPRTVKAEFDKHEIGHSTYYRHRNGSVVRYTKLSDGAYMTHHMTRSKCKLPTSIKIDPPPPFKTWSDYKRFYNLE